MKPLLIVFTLAFLPSLSSFAVNPVIQPLPDFRLRTNVSAPQVLRLNDFVRDFESVDYESSQFGVSWQVFKIDPAANAVIDATSSVSLSAVTNPEDGGVYLFTVTDASANAFGSSNTFKSSSFFLRDPWLEPDPRINPTPGVLPFVVPLDPQVGGSGNWEAFGVFSSIGALPANWGNVTINQVYTNTGQFDPSFQTLAQGNPVGVLNTIAAAAPAGGNFTISAGDQLEGPYVLGFRGENSSMDWDGATMLVSATILSSSSPQSHDTPDYARDERFEGISGRLTEVGFNRYNPNPLGSGNVRVGPAKCSWEHLVGLAAAANVLYGSAEAVANTTLPANLQTPNASFTGDHSDGVLRVTVWPNRPMVFLKRVRSLPDGVTAAGETGTVQAGIPYAVDASVASNAPDANSAPLVSVAVHTEAFTEIAVASQSQGALPIAGQGWLQMRSIVEPSQASLYSNPSGLRVSLVVYASPLATGPVEVYIDNVYMYRSTYDTNLARGASRNRIIGGSATRFPGTVRGDFEAATGEMRGPGISGLGNTNGWFISQAGEFAQTPPGTFVGVTPSALSTQLKAGDANWLEMNYSTAISGPQLVHLRTPDLVAPNDEPLTDGVYDLQMDYLTPSGAAEIPYLILALSTNNFQSYARYELGMPTQGTPGTQGAIRKLHVQAPLRNVSNLVALVISYQGVVPQADSVAYIDNIELHKINDRQEYWDLGLFDAAP